MFLAILLMMGLSFSVSLAGIVGALECVKMQTKAAEKISKEITSNLSHKIEENIRRDIDNGRFFY